MDVGSDLSGRPLILAGMHRSGTSLTASILAAAGVYLGDDLLPAQHGNDEGHFEDVGILRFHERVLRSLGLESDGFTTQRVGLEAVATRHEARALIAERARPNQLWGWKEPRTVLFLEYWRQVLPDARHLFVFRSPWEIADSLYRRGDRAFHENPFLALELWLYYNRAIVDFTTAHPDRCLIMDIRQVIADPGGLLDAVRTRLELPVGRAPDRFREDLFVRGDSCHRAALVKQVLPEAFDMYESMVRDSGSSFGIPAADPVCVTAGSAREAIAEWARASRAEAFVRYLSGENIRLAGEVQSLRARRSRWKTLPQRSVASLVRRMRHAFRDGDRQAATDGPHERRGEPVTILPFKRPSQATVEKAATTATKAAA
jgi:hypothetical protein